MGRGYNSTSGIGGRVVDLFQRIRGGIEMGIAVAIESIGNGVGGRNNSNNNSDATTRQPQLDHDTHDFHQADGRMKLGRLGRYTNQVGDDDEDDTAQKMGTMSISNNNNNNPTSTTIAQPDTNNENGNDKTTRGCCNCLIVQLVREYGWDVVRLYFYISLVFSFIIGLMLYFTNSTTYTIWILSSLPFGVGQWISKKFTSSISTMVDDNNDDNGSEQDRSIDPTSISPTSTTTTTTITNKNEIFLLLAAISVINNLLEPIRIALLLYSLRILSLNHRYDPEFSPFLARYQWLLWVLNFRSTEVLGGLPLISQGSGGGGDHSTGRGAGVGDNKINPNDSSFFGMDTEN